MTEQEIPTNIFYFVMLIFRLNSFSIYPKFEIKNGPVGKLAYITPALLHSDTQIVKLILYI